MRRVILPLALGLAILGLFAFNKQTEISATKPAALGANSFLVKIKDASIAVELADTWRKRARGLSGRATLPADQGMLFIFNRPDFYSFWMRGMKFPIDIIWIDENLRIVGVDKNVSPASFPRAFRPSAPAQYVLETAAGMTEANDIAPDEVADFSWK